ncbi:MAG: gliding motility-associated C-terminal domain-containing protein [Bacteroidales bacterium]
MKRLLIIGIILAFCSNIEATHNRAGEITYKQISGLTYEVTITTFTYTLSNADRDTLIVNWGDNSFSNAPRISKISLPNFYNQNIYVARHTFPGPGTYNILVQDPNRNYGVENIPNSVNVIFSIKSTLIINPQAGYNSTPQLLNPPIDKATIGKLFIHNPGVYDPEGDSISYKLTVCTGEDGEPIQGYEFPEKSDTFYVNELTGDLVWDAPVDSGIFNVAILIEEWRNGILIGTVTRDMQIDVYSTDNNPPELSIPENHCIIANELLQFSFSATDIDNDSIHLSGSGGPFLFKPDSASIEVIEKDKGLSRGLFSWQTNCTHVREQPYNLYIKATDDNDDVILSDIDDFTVKVMGPAPRNLSLTPSNNSVFLTWSTYMCPNISGFEIYRRTGPSSYIPDTCETGIPESAGFELAGFVNLPDTFFMDNNDGEGLIQGNEYCYRIVAVFENGARSIPSEEICTYLVPGIPPLIKTSVEISENDGTVDIAWIQPRGLDTIPAKGPYEIIIYRSNDLWGNNFSPIDTIDDANLSDTIYTDNPLNTLLYPYSYKVEIYNDAPGDRRLLGSREIASTLYPELTGEDNQVTLEMIKNVPWLNESYTIYRSQGPSENFDSIAVTYNETYIDTGLTNKREYCYRIESHGYRILNGERVNTTNLSHVNCTFPVDTSAPCPPVLEVTSFCDSAMNLLNWTNPNNFCADDVVGYRIYYSPLIDTEPSFIAAVNDPEDTTYYHEPEFSLAGCYYVTAIDSFDNESSPSIIICTDECILYKLPNVFTPNGDNVNDILRAYNKNGYVKKVDMKIFNRWGQLVYETSDPYINWDGRHQQNKNLVSPGVYYYICDVYEPRLTGIETRNIVGFVHVYWDEEPKNFQNE